jgi:hypothetical protein
MNGFGSPIEAFLDPGERLLWSGQPRQGLLLQASDIFVIPFSLMWGGFAIFWETIAIWGVTSDDHPNHQAVWFMPLWGIPFVVIGLYMIFGRFFFDAATRKKTYYGLTNQRLIILKTLFNRNVASFDVATMTNLNLVERGDRSGDILIGSPASTDIGTSFGQFGNRRTRVPGFYLLPDARTVYNQIRDVQKQGRR